MTASGQRRAVASHAAAVLGHAARIGLIAPSGDASVDAKSLAALHPALAAFADITPDPSDVQPEALDGREQVVGHQLGDAYQALSEEARKGRALCQTPAFVTDLLLNISFTHAYQAWGPDIRMIDPACGTGHILVETLLRAHSYHQHGLCRSSRDTSPRLPWRTPPMGHITASLNVVHGVDLDPYAVLVARYRLLTVALTVLRNNWRYEPTPQEIAALPLNVACANSLLDEDEPLLEHGRYHVVVANPPYITVKDAKANKAIRDRYPQVCNGKYSLALPFHALMNDLLVDGGWCAQLTANSFMKREFGRRYIEDYLTNYDLTWVIDTSGAYIPGHGTPTLILANRNQRPTRDVVPTVQGVRGEPSLPADPARGLVWLAIERAVAERESYARLSAVLTPAPEPAPIAATPASAKPLTYEQPSLFELMKGAA